MAITAAKLPWPFGGRSDNTGFSDQEPLTTEEGKNVRGVDPVTGRVRGSQRPGLTELLTGFAKAQGTKIDWMGSVTHGKKVADWAYGLESDYDFFNVPEDPNGVIQWRARTVGNAAALDVVVDREGAVYVLDALGVVSKYDSDGDRLEFTSVPLAAGLEPVKRLEIDTELNLYTASTSSFGTDVGTIHRLTPTDKGFFDVAWTLDTKGAPIDFRQQSGFLYVLEDIEDTEDGPQKAQVSVYINGLDASVHLGSWAVPHPASAIEVSPAGAVFVTCPANPNRNKTVDGFTAHTDGWVPHQYDAAEERIWTWMDALVLPNPANGAKVEAWPDRRFHIPDSALISNSALRVLDETKRPFRMQPNLGEGELKPLVKSPTYAESAFGQRAGIRFNGNAPVVQPGLLEASKEFGKLFQGLAIRFVSENTPYWPFVDGVDYVSGQGLRSFGSADFNPKALPIDSWPTNRALLPPPSVTFVTGIIIRLDRDAAPGIVFQHKALGIQLGILSNVRPAGYTKRTFIESADRDDTHTKAPGWLTVFIQGDEDDATHAFEFQYEQLFDATDNTTDVAIITFTFDQVASDHTFIRINGVPIAAIASGSWPSNAGTGQTLGISNFGGYIGGYRSGADIFNYGLRGFSGWVGEALTILGETTTNPHDTAFNLGFHASSVLNNGESWTEVVPSAYPHAVTEPNETEKLEGYLAHKWGVSHILPNGRADAKDASTVLYKDHPFGGTARPPINTFSGLPAAEDADALALKSTQPILAKYSGIFGELRWAFAGTGVGYQVAVDSDHDVIGAGEFRVADQRGLSTGLNQRAPTIRKIVDLGNTFKTNELRTGTLTFTGAPADGDTFTVTLDGTAKVFTFRDTPVADEDIDRSGAPSATLMATRTNDALYVSYLNDIPHGYWHTLTADNVLGIVTVEVNLADLPASPGTISLVESATNLAAVDFTGGVRVVDSWVQWDRSATSDAPAPATAGLRMIVDDDDDIWQPFQSDGLQAYQLFRWTADGGAQFIGGAWTAFGTPNGIAQRRYRVGLIDPGSNFPNGAAVALSPGVPNYGTDPASGARYFYLAADLTDDATEQETADNIWKVEANVRTAINTVTTHRDVKSILISGGDGKRFARGGSYTTPTNGAALFDSASKWISGTELFGKIYLSDGIKKKVYDPETDQFDDWKAESGGGQVPDSIKLLTTWRGRIVAVSHDDPFNIHFSKLGDALNWNEFPPEGASLEMAISFSNPVSLGESPDIITAFIPINGDKQALIGGDHTIQLLMNDPVAASIGDTSQPALIEVSNKEGIAFGQNAWTKDPEGNVFLKGSKLGIYAYAGGQLLRISENRIERALDNINLEDYRVALSWAPREEGMYVLQLPTGAGGVAIQGWFWEKKTASWWDVEFDATAIQPTSVMVLDGDDPLDRRLCIGTEDGKILFWDRDAANDDGGRVVSSVLLGPYEFAQPDREGRLVSLQVTLAADQHGCECEVYVSNQADSKGSPVWSGTLRAGFNRITIRARGAYVWVRYLNSTVGERFAHEHTVVRVTQAGRRKVGS